MPIHINIKGILAGAALLAFAVPVSASEIVALKHALYGAGYDIENVNGTMDQSTQSALKSFQQEHPELEVTGELDDSTKKALGMVSVKVARRAPKQDEAPQAETNTAANESRAEKEDGFEEDEDGGWSFF